MVPAPTCIGPTTPLAARIGDPRTLTKKVEMPFTGDFTRILQVVTRLPDTTPNNFSTYFSLHFIIAWYTICVEMEACTHSERGSGRVGFGWHAQGVGRIGITGEITCNTGWRFGSSDRP